MQRICSIMLTSASDWIQFLTLCSHAYAELFWRTAECIIKAALTSPYKQEIMSFFRKQGCNEFGMKHALALLKAKETEETEDVKGVESVEEGEVSSFPVVGTFRKGPDVPSSAEKDVCSKRQRIHRD